MAERMKLECEASCGFFGGADMTLF
jgi:hypothetical protein